MIVMAYMIVRNDVQDANDLLMMYAVLCIMNFIFDLVPLIMGLEQGRTTVTNGETAERLGNGVEQIDTTQIFKTTPFFDDKLGFRYNLQSVNLIVSPLINAFGAYLSLKAVYEVQASLPDDFDSYDEERAPFFAPPGPRGRPARG